MNISDEIKVGPWYFTFEWHEDRPDYGSIYLSGLEEVIAFGEFVSRENWEAFKDAVL